MKRLLPLLLVLLLLSGCAAKPSIRPADLAKGEQTLLRMFNQNYPGQVFDFTAPEGTVGLIIRRHQLQEGGWVSASYYLPVTEKTGRIAISFDDLAHGLHCAILQDGEVQSTASQRHGAADKNDGIFTATELLKNAAEAALNAEIPLLMQLHAAGNEMPFPGASMADYPNAAAFAAYDAAYLITATFTDKPLV